MLSSPIILHDDPRHLFLEQTMNSQQINRYLFIASVLFLCFTFGCGPPVKVAEKEKPKPVLGGKTQEIGEWNPNGDQQLHENDEVNMINRTRVGATHAINEVSRLTVKRAVDLFWAAEGRYPKSHEEFMKKVIIANKIELPMPVTSCEYQYDVKNHELVIVKKKKEKNE